MIENHLVTALGALEGRVDSIIVVEGHLAGGTGATTDCVVDAANVGGIGLLGVLLLGEGVLGRRHYFNDLRYKF